MSLPRPRQCRCGVASSSAHRDAAQDRSMGSYRLPVREGSRRQRLGSPWQIPAVWGVELGTPVAIAVDTSPEMLKEAHRGLLAT